MNQVLGFLRLRPVMAAFTRAGLAFALVELAGIAGCNASRERESASSTTHDTSFMPRQEVVAMADRLAAAVGQDKGREAQEQLLRAANLREWIWRLEGKKADGLEAVELLSDVGTNGNCRARIASIALRVEVDGNPATAISALTELLGTETEPECLVMVRRLLGLYAAKVGEPVGADAPGANDRNAANAAGAQDIIPLLSTANQAVVPRIRSVERYGAKDSARIVVALTHPATFRAGMLRAEDAGGATRLYVDIDRAVIDKAENYEVGGLVRRIRLGQRPDGTRLVLDLEESAERRIFYVPEPFRLVIDVARGKNVIGFANRGPRVIERIVVDPGHGGHDPGAIGPRGLREKDVTLDIAHRAAPLIARELGLSTLLTRDTDTFVALDERSARANAFRADLFVSIHCNAAEKTGSDGVMTFVLDTSSDAAASRMAALENAASDAAAKELATAVGRTQDEGLLTRSVHFAELLQRSTLASLSPNYGPIQDQGVRRAGFYVLAGAHMPAVLFEVAFISNPDGEVRLNTADYRQKLADALVNAVRAYRDGL